MDDRYEARVRGILLGKFRIQQLHEALHRNNDLITAVNSAQWYRLMQTYLPKRLNREVIEGEAENHKKIIGKFVIVQLKIEVCTLNTKNALLLVQFVLPTITQEC